MANVLAFFAASVLLALSPGPDNLFVLSQAMRQGRLAGFAITLGLSTGLIGHTLLVASGAAVVLHRSPYAFTVLTWCGAGYLLWLAWQAWHSQALPAGSHSDFRSLSKLYRRGIVMNLSNPKVAIFFLAFLPQFTNPERGGMFWQLLGLGGVFMFATLLVFGLISCLAGSLTAYLTQWQPRLAQTSGVLFVVLALKLVVFP